MTRFARGALAAPAIALLLCGTPRALAGQFPTRTQLLWQTIETKRFAFHYPIELEAWTRAAASHVEAIDSAVSQVVGFRLEARTDVVVDDPFQRPNGSAWPYLDRPLINLWASPPTPRDDIGDYAAWSQMLIAHEFGHVAHLSRPSRNATTHWLWSAMPVTLGPIALRAPRWVIEGYATFIEGRVTGTGRPHSAWRAAYLRQWALEGQLPRYDQLDSWRAYEGGSFAYLAGSAFIEWLADQRGDSSFVEVWRRLSARQNRTFDAAFAGVFGQSAAALYGRFTVDLTERSLRVARAIAATRADTGAIVQRLARSTGDPAISHDGKHVAIVLRSATAPSRVVIWATAAEPDTARRRRDSLLIAADPEDVPARSIYPRPRRALFTLRARGGASYESPRFLRDGRVLLSRSTARGDGSYTDDLYLWNPQVGSVRRVTRGASVRDADPSPDGRTAVATRCRGGWCALVSVRLDDGAVTTMIWGSEEHSFFRPRLAPDGSTVLVNVHHSGTWRLATVAPSTHALTFLGPDDGANRYDGAWASADTILAVSDKGGIANIVEIVRTTGESRTLSNVTGAAVAPERNPADGSVWFLSFYFRGYDLRRVSPPGAAGPSPVTSPARLTPALSPPPVDLARFPTNAVSTPRAFGLTPRLFRWIPQPALDADGASGGLSLVSRDIIGRSELVAAGAYGTAAAWRGGSVSGTWAGSRPALRVAVYGATQTPSESRSNRVATRLLDVSLIGGEADIEDTRRFDTWASRVRVGGSVARIRGWTTPVALTRETGARALAFADGAVTLTRRAGPGTLTGSLRGNVTAGESFGAQYARGLGDAEIAAGGPGIPGLSVSALYGSAGDGTPAFERFALGGGPSIVLDRRLLAQRIVMPAIPEGISIGSSVFAYRAAIGSAPFSLYWWAGSTADDDRFRAWQRVVGVEWTVSVPAIAAAGTPAARARFGVGESLDEPVRRRVRAYLSLVLNP